MENENKPEENSGTEEGLRPEKRLETIMRAARMFLASPTTFPEKLQRIHTRDGLLVATDGRALLRVEDSCIFEMPDSATEILAFSPEDGDVLIADREKISALRARVYEAWCEEAARIDKLEEEFDEDTRVNTQCCPCCGAMIYVDSFRGLVNLDDRERDRPDDRNSSRYVRVCTADREDAYSLYNLRRMLDAANVLGGADKLRLGQRELQLRGANWIALCLGVLGMPMRSEIAFDLDFREVRT